MVLSDTQHIPIYLPIHLFYGKTCIYLMYLATCLHQKTAAGYVMTMYVSYDIDWEGPTQQDVIRQ